MKRYGHWLLTICVVVAFVQSLFFKFTRAPETIYIFEGKLDPWAASLGFPGVFAPGGVSSAYVIGTFELVTSVLLIIGTLVVSLRALRVLGAALGLGVISGAICLHLFTPLGVAVQNTDGSSDGGQLFMLACGVWVSCAALLWLNRSIWLAWLGRRG